MRLRVLLYTVLALLLVGLTMALAELGAKVVVAQPSPPALISPSNGGTIVTPTFLWNAVAGAARYDIQVSADESFTSVAWSESTIDLTITPVSTLANGSFWWRVRSVDAGGGAGPWSVPWSFAKQIPAPVPSSPSDGATTIIPTFRWKTASGAAYYRVQMASNNTFTNIVWQDDIYGLSVTPVDTLPNGILYWRLWGVDADGHTGESTTTWSFTKQIPAPTLVSPADGASIVTPMFEWQTIAGATYYHIQVATNSAFTAVVWQADTYDLRITPVSTLPNGTLYWRVWGVDADGHDGDISASRTVEKQIPVPALVSPDNGITVTTPTFRWQPVEGAAYYHIQVAANPTFTSIMWESDTHNPVITSVADVSPGVRYWRVLGVDADGHEGGYSDYRSITLEAPPACGDPAVVLQDPPHDATLASDPDFRWTCMQNATRYRVLVKRGDTIVLSAYTFHTSYTPYYASSGSARTLANASYTWTIEAYNGSTLLYTTSSGAFSKAAPFELNEPQDGTSVASDPTLGWQVLQGANRYKVLILQGGTLIAQAYTEYPTYIPYYVSSGSEQVLAGGAYRWQVEAYNGSILLTTSAIRTFNKGSSLGLVGPSDGAAVTGDPTLQWEPLSDANRYKVLIYKGPTLYAFAFSRYTIYTPFYDASGSVEALPDGSYSWQVEAYYGSTMLTTSKSRTFTKTSSFGLAAPSDGATLAGDPTLQWHVVGAEPRAPCGDASRYKVLIYRNQVLVSYAFTEYPIYTPYNHGAGSVETLPDGSYVWKVEAYQGNTLITTSPARSFTISAGAPTVTPTPSPMPTLTPTVTATPSTADAFETDNGCGEARLISSDGLPQTHSFHIWGDQDWLRFDATAGKTYVIRVSNTGPRADPVLFLYNTCGNASLGGADNAFGNDVSLEWNVDVGGWYYLKVQQHDADTYGEGTNYDVSVTLDATPPEAPRNPRCASRSQDTVDVQWQQNSEPDTARYIVNYHDELNNESGSRDVEGAATTYYSLNGLLFANRLYSMRVKAEDFSGNGGAESEEVSCQTSQPSDHSNPTVSLQQPTGDAEFTTSVGAISFMGGAQDLGNNLSRVRVANTANGAQGWDYGLSGGSASFSVADIALQPGDNPIQVDAVDEAGNVGSLSVTVHRVVEGGNLGAAIIIGGHSETYSLQSNIDAVTNRTYEVFRNAGYDDEHIHYLSPTPQDPDEDGASEVDAPTTSANLEAAIRTWAAAYVGPGRPLTLYLMDHGLIERFCSDGCNSEYTSPDALDAALSDLEGSTGVEEINVIIEACHSGSFLDRQNGMGSVSKAGRVVITSTDREHNAYASAQGAYFSDAFLTCVAGSGSVSACFNQAKAAVGLTGVSQSPWLDDNGDGVSNPSDGTIAQSRYLAHLFGASPPVITDGEVLIEGASGTLTAQVNPGSDPVKVVWADIFGPSFLEPTGTTLNLGVPSVRLDQVATSPGLYRAAYPNGFAEPGRYHVIFYTQDRKGLQATPKLKVIGGGEVFLPIVLRW